ncbi:CheY-like superfamily [Penicillium sp. DV-2018c]|nr:CheY-like superfamily [Penicillium sp. DV-2018c]
MNSAGVRAFHSVTPEEHQERERIRDLSRYYCTFPRNGTVSDEEASAAPTGDEQPAGCTLAEDIPLNALAQLGVLRFKANRCFVSIIDGDTQHIIAETTGSVSLRDKEHHLPGDGIYLGARSLDLIWGVCPHTVRLFTGRSPETISTDNVTANRTRYIIRDFTREDCFKDRPYVRDWPHMRFYAEVPLFSASGYVLGSYCIVDDKPWTEFGDQQVKNLQEVADAIGLHLENVRMREAHIRTEKLVKGLTTFVKDHASFNPTEVSNDGRLQSSFCAANLSPEEIAAATASADPDAVPVPAPFADSTFSPGRSRSSTVTAEESISYMPDQRSSTDPSSLASGMSDRPMAVTPGEERSQAEALRSGDTSVHQNIDKQLSLLSLTENKSFSERIASIYARASTLLRDSMDLDGVMFLDACPTNFAFVPEASDMWEPVPPGADLGFPTAPRPSPLGLPRPVPQEFDLPCDILSCALKPELTTGKGDRNSGKRPSIPQGLLHQLLRVFPRGQSLNLSEIVDEDDYLSNEYFGAPGPGIEPNLQTCSKHLARCIPSAKSALFLPLWDWNKSRWLSGVLVWTGNTFRSLGPEELHYFKVFGDSVVSELSRQYWASTERSKFDFITSVSHELRSPLHGILASAELLNATSLGPAQREMVTMIEKSGLTLLDTTDNMLEFCKVNSLNHTKNMNVTVAENDTASLVSDFDVSHLIEEVANVLYVGQRAPEQVSQLASRITSNAEATYFGDVEVPAKNQLSIVIRVDQSDTWMIRSVAGAWRRIVMNVVGNAMNWTTAGFIEIALSKVKGRSNSQSPLVHLSITDTGRGIAADFVKHKLFAPFAQEDPLSEGVGLGLSTVQQLVMSLGGHVNVRSEIGVGTQVDVYLPVQYLPANSGPEASLGPASTQVGTPPMHACLVGFSGGPDLTEAPTGILTVQGKRKLSIQSALASIFVTKMKWAISLADSMEVARGNVIVIEEELLKQAMHDNGQSVSEIATKNGIDFFVVLSGNSPIILDNLCVNIIRIAQPFGPQKIYDAVERIMNWRELQTAPSSPGIGPEASSSLIARQAKAASSSESVSTITAAEDSGHSKEETTSSGIPGPSIPQSSQSSTKEGLAHVLIVDDNEINLKIMATFLRKINCTYDTAHNGLVALEKYKSSKSHYDFVLMDISMPVMDGLVSTSKIREHERLNGISPSCIMAVTGVSSAGFQQQAYAAGIDKYLLKPLSLHNLKILMNVA